MSLMPPRFGRRENAGWAFNAGNVQEFMNVWPNDDIVVMVPGAPAIVGKPALRTFLEQAFAGARIDERLTPLEQVIAGEWAFERLAVSETIEPKAGGDAVHLEGKALDVYRKQVDGCWKVARSILNYNA